MNTQHLIELRTRLEQAGLIKPVSALDYRRSRQPALEQLVSGSWYDIAGVRCFRAEQNYPLSHVHGSSQLNELLELPSGVWSPFIVNSETSLDLRKAIFLDIETSGLAQNPSTYVFMVGAGWFETDAFLLRQYFMPDFASEEGLLALFEQDIRQREGLVTFNGRCFDWPLLEMRYLMNRRNPPDIARPHLDLLPLARRLWRRRYGSCALSSLEINLLGIRRTREDVPGYLIPQLYQEYVANHRIEPIAGIFYHNAQDILSMVSLATTAGHTLRILDEPTQVEGIDYFALGALFQRLGRPKEALQAMQLAAENSLEVAELDFVNREWSLLLKRLGQWEEAAAIWKTQLNGNAIYPYTELAKYYEHQLRDIDLAIQIVQQALEYLQKPDLPLSRLERQQAYQEFNHRLERLVRKRRCNCAAN